MAQVLRATGHETVEFGTGEEAVEFARQLRPALAVAEVLLPRMPGYELCHALKEQHGNELPVVLVSEQRAHPADRVAGLLIGADDYLIKPLHPAELLARARRLLEPRSTRLHALGLRLTPREAEVLALMADGLGHRDIATRLVITPRTVAKHIEHILAKLGVHSRAQAVALALRPDRGAGGPWLSRRPTSWTGPGLR